MDRNFLFIIGMILPGTGMAAVPDAAGLDYGSRFADNWTTVTAGGGRLFFALSAGVLLAFAFQWILTSLSFALGISALGRASQKKKPGGYRSSGRFEDRDEFDEEDAEERAERMRREERKEKDRREKEARGETEWDSGRSSPRPYPSSSRAGWRRN
jgi:hypothetical protein